MSKKVINLKDHEKKRNKNKDMNKSSDDIELEELDEYLEELESDFKALIQTDKTLNKSKKKSE